MTTGKNFVINKQNAHLYAHAIAYRVRDELKTLNRKGIVLGMSGGVNCSVVATLCRLINIPTHLIMMPYGDDMSKSNSQSHAMELIERFHFPHHTFNIKPDVDAQTISTDAEIEESINLLARANILPRVRMTHLYHFADVHNYLVAGTCNLSKRTVGYFTKWGEGACDFNPLSFLTKREVYILARFLNVPDSILSAGLLESQADESELGITYSQIDDYLLSGTSGTYSIDVSIENKALASKHKFVEVPTFNSKISYTAERTTS